MLLAEDNADMRDYVRRLLAERWEVETVADGSEALARALAAPPDLVLTDVMMPGLDGFSLLAALRENPATSTIPIILLSARAGEEARSEGMDAGADDYLVKPFSARELLARVGAHLKLAQARREAEQAVRESEERFRAFVTATSDAVYRVSADWSELRYLRGHNFIADTVGPSRSWMQKYIHPDDQPALMAAIRRARDTNTPFEMEHRVITADGRLGWTFSRAIPVRDDSGEVTEWFGAARDITERKRGEEELRQLNSELQRINRELEEFAYVASHDLQEPIRMVSIYTELLLRRFVTDELDAKRYAAFIQAGVNRMQDLVRDLLKFSRTIQPELLPETSTADLSAALQSALGVLRTRIEETSARITAEPLPQVRGDADQLVHVFQNLIENALKYRKLDAPPAIRIAAELRDDEWIISIHDNGIGFKPEYADRIFGLFKRLHKNEYPGTGLGLAICKRIVEKFGGRIWAEGRPDNGATFFFTLLRTGSPDGHANRGTGDVPVPLT